MITEADLQWWLEVAEWSEWTWAKTYADSAPHWYVVLGRTPELTKEDFVRAARVIHTFGQPGMFHGHVNIYLEHGEWKWWTMDPLVEDTDLINRAKVSEVYGPQLAPATLNPAGPAFYDTVATEYDAMWQAPTDLLENQQVTRLLGEHFRFTAPSVLDVGCGTGLLLDLGITASTMYTGIDPSQGMLNQLMRKHPRVRNLLVGTASEVLPTLGDQQFDLVCALFASASYMTMADWMRMISRAQKLAVFMTYEKDYLPDYWEGEERRQMLVQIEQARVEMLELASRVPNTTRTKIGRFDVTVVKR